ncbi:hypothetical protein BpHYR1_050071 [Brachionus plicatilis]|uniref:Uncharacterized protein n=1 Tax=Brachionus plicatilis TaxID=10195 RepID=A0A3M7PP84_BRAPC|nr:hypothetical protein BpHYR1_050071 [Brachionus plicatilis]
MENSADSKESKFPLWTVAIIKKNDQDSISSTPECRNSCDLGVFSIARYDSDSISLTRKSRTIDDRLPSYEELFLEDI